MYAQNTNDDGYFDAPEQVFEDEDVSEIIFRLRHAGRAHDFAMNIDMVLLKVERLAFSDNIRPLENDDYATISRALGDAAEAGYLAPPVGLTQGQTMQGLWLLAYAFAFWNLPDDQRAAKSKWRTALRQALRIFRNAVHNSCLLAEVGQIVEARSAEPTPSLIVDIGSCPGFLEFPTETLRNFAEAFSAAA